MNRWNEIIKSHGIDFTLTLPHRGFRRAIGAFAEVKVSPDGRVVGEAEWDARHRDWLPTDEDQAYVASLMQPVTERQVANWIAPPARGINSRKPPISEYVVSAEAETRRAVTLEDWDRRWMYCTA